MKDDTFKIRLDADLKVRFMDAAEGSNQAAAQIVREFMRSYAEKHERKAAQVSHVKPRKAGRK